MPVATAQANSNVAIDDFANTASDGDGSFSACGPDGVSGDMSCSSFIELRP
jgi:hypothetical protein